MDPPALLVESVLRVLLVPGQKDRPAHRLPEGSRVSLGLPVPQGLRMDPSRPELRRPEQPREEPQTDPWRERQQARREQPALQERQRDPSRELQREQPLQRVGRLREPLRQRVLPVRLERLEPLLWSQCHPLG